MATRPGSSAFAPNECVLVVGDCGMGKSTYAAHRARDYVSQGWRVWAYDHTLTLRGPDVERVGDVAAGLRSSKPIRVLVCPSILPVLDGARREAASGPNPVLCVIEEGAGVPEISPNRIHPDVRAALVMRRHHRVGYLWIVQSPEMIHYNIVTQSTEVVAFRTSDRERIERLARGGFPPPSVERLPTLEPFTAIHWRRQ